MGGLAPTPAALMTARFGANIIVMRATAIVALALAGLVTHSAAQAEDPEISSRRAAERRAFTDAEITEGFFKTAFGAELPIGDQPNRIRKFDGAVLVYIDSHAQPDRRAQVAEVVANIRAHVRHLDIAVTDNRSAANVMVTLVRDRDLPRTIRKVYGRAQARKIQSSLTPQCLSSFRKDEAYRITYSDVILVADIGDFVFYDCIYEELLQALGPINDTDAVPWTMFNDDVHMGFFDIYDQYLLNILYDPRIRPGMTVDEVRAVLPQVLADVKAFVASTNNLEP